MPGRKPPKLYKYVTAERIDILRNGRVRFTPPEALNDPFDMRPASTLAVMASDVERHRLHTAAAFDAHLRRGFASTKQRADDLRAQTGVLSLTADPDNLLMWSHYADHHRGLVIEFAAEHEFFHRRQSGDDEFHHVRRVRYARDRPSTGTGSFRDPKILLTKSVEWRYEREWRMLVDFSRFDHHTLRDGGQEIHLVPVPPGCITGIILGARMPDDARDAMAAFVAGDPRYAHVSVRCAELDPSGFAVVLERGERYLERGRKLMEEARVGTTEDPSVLFEAAVAELDRALRYDPSSYLGRVWRAGAHQGLGNLEAAAGDYGRAVDVAPEAHKADLLILRAQVLVSLGREAEADQDLERARQLVNPPAPTRSRPARGGATGTGRRRASRPRSA